MAQTLKRWTLLGAGSAVAIGIGVSAQDQGPYRLLGKLFGEQLQFVDPEGLYERAIEILRYAQADLDLAIQQIIDGDSEGAIGSLIQVIQKLSVVSELMSTAPPPEITELNAEALRLLDVILLDTGLNSGQLPQYIAEEARQVRILIESSFQADDPRVNLAEARPRINRLFAIVASAIGFDLMNPAM